jgi:hypothetical protein
MSDSVNYILWFFHNNFYIGSPIKRLIVTRF